MKLSGTVIEGDGYGKKLGFPTVNIDRDEYQKSNKDLSYGVYAGWVSTDAWDMPKRAGLVIGPEDEWGLPKLEAHIINFEGNLYGEKVTLHFSSFLRKFTEYDSEEALRLAITEDIDNIKSLELCLPE